MRLVSSDPGTGIRPGVRWVHEKQRYEVSIPGFPPGGIHLLIALGGIGRRIEKGVFRTRLRQRMIEMNPPCTTVYSQGRKNKVVAHICNTEGYRIHIFF
jgi:hypothetical protein